MQASNYKSSVVEWKAQQSMSLLEAVSHKLGGKPSVLTPMDLLELGCAYINNERQLDPAKKIRSGDLLRLHTAPRRFHIPADLKQRIVKETQEYIVVEKPAFLPTGPVVDNLIENLTYALRDRFLSTLFPVYDVEIETAGLVVLAKSQSALERYSSAFKAGKIIRRFVAFVEQLLPEGSSTLRVLSCTEYPSTDLIVEGRNSWTVLEKSFTSLFRLEVEQATGRPSEVRDFLAANGAPIVGDQKRGSKTVLKDIETGKLSPAFCTIAIDFPF